MKKLLLYLLIIFSGLNFQVNKPSVIKWVVINGCWLKVDGSTNVNNFSCAINSYNIPDTILVTRSGSQSILSAFLFTRKDIDVTLMRMQGILFQERGTDSISNLYNIKLANKTTEKIPLTLKLEESNGTIEAIGKPYIEVEKRRAGERNLF